MQKRKKSSFEPKVILTVYHDTTFRSRTEARWAVFFDVLKIKWEYEKEGYELDCGRYLPDFWLPYTENYKCKYIHAGEWIEIKGQYPSKKEIKKMLSLSRATKHSGNIFSGPPQRNLSWLRTHNTGNVHTTDERHGYLFAYISKFTDLNYSPNDFIFAINRSRSYDFGRR